MQIDPKILNGLSEDQALRRVLELGIRNGVLPSHATVEPWIGLSLYASSM